MRRNYKHGETGTLLARASNGLLIMLLNLDQHFESYLPSKQLIQLLITVIFSSLRPYSICLYLHKLLALFLSLASISNWRSWCNSRILPVCVYVFTFGAISTLPSIRAVSSSCIQSVNPQKLLQC